MEKTLTFTVEDALLSPLGFSILSGAGLFNKSNQDVHVHQTVIGNIETASGTTVAIEYYRKTNPSGNTYEYVRFSPNAETIEYLDYLGAESNTDYLTDITTLPTADANSAQYVRLTKSITADTAYIDVEDAIGTAEICNNAPIYLSVLKDGSIVDKLSVSSVDGAKIKISGSPTQYMTGDYTVAADFYILKKENVAMELQIDAENFAGTYYVEADTLVRKQSSGKDCPAILTIPLVKIQSNFTFTMASSGDPSTFTFTMDAMPAYTYFNKKQKVLCTLQIIDEEQTETTRDAVMRHGSGYTHSGFNN